MYDYMKAMQKRFDHQSHPELDTQIKSAHEELRRDMDAAGRRKLLHLLDAQNALLAESTLMSFTAASSWRPVSPESWERPTPSTPTKSKKQRR